MIHSQVHPIGQHIRLARSATVQKIQAIIRQHYGANYRVELFGSTSYGVDTPTSDLDLVILVRTRFHPHPHALPNFDQDAVRMDGFPPSLDLASLPCKWTLLLLGAHRSCHSQVIYNVRSVTAGALRNLEG
jgi:hypothetical protein